MSHLDNGGSYFGDDESEVELGEPKVGFRSADSHQFTSHTAVQISEITNFCVTDVDNREHFTSKPRISKHSFMNKGSPLPVFLKFEDVKFEVPRFKPQKCSQGRTFVHVSQDQCRQILHGVTGLVKPGEILAIMGPSGCGKTSLLRILAGRLLSGVSGRVTYNDIPYSGSLKRRIGFVTQDDVLFPQLTVKETLIFAALLRLPSTMKKDQKISRAEVILKDLGLERCKDTRVGGVFVQGVSGGERKRTSIGYELLVDPSVLFLDEPTSGLDSSTALMLLKVVQKNAKIGRTVIMTIHQPSSRLFHMFDKLILLSEGHPIYYGKAKDAMQYFADHQFVPQLVMNPADFLLDLATGKVDCITLPSDLRNSEGGKTSPAEERVEPLPDEIISLDSPISDDKISKIVIKALQNKYRTEIEPLEIQELLEKAPEHLQVQMQVRRDWTSSWITQFIVLSKRMVRERRRDYVDILRLLQAVGVAILLGLLWFQLKIETEAQLRDQVGLLFYICIFWSSSSIYAAVYNFPLEQFYLAKERAADMYRLSAYHFSSTICDIPAQLGYPFLFMTILYFMAGFHRTATAFFLTQVSVGLIVLAGQGVGELFGAVVLDVKKAGTVVSLVLLIFLLTGGYYVQHIPVFMRWLKYISFVYYGFHLLLKVQYSPHQMYECSEKGGCKSIQLSPTFQGIVDLNGGVKEAVILVAMAVIFRVLAYIFLRRIKIET